MFNKILLVRIGNIGDVLFTTPVIRKLRNSFPGAIINMVTSNHGKLAVEANPYLNEIFIYHKFHRFERWFKRRQFLKKLSAHRYDLCIVLESNFEYTQFASKAAKEALRVGIDSPFAERFLDEAVEFSQGKHALENYLCVLSQLLNIKTSPEDYSMDFFFSLTPHTLEKELSQYDKNRFFIIHPSCSARLPYRGWQLDKVVKLAKYLTRQGIDVFITGAVADKEPKLLLEQLVNEPLVHSFVGRSLNEVGYLIKKAKGIFCFDTGILHLARALAAPLVTIFGPSDPRHTGPIGKGVYRVIRKDFPCGPCHYTLDYRLAEKANCLNGNVPACMQAIEAGEVIEAVQSIIHEKREP